MTILVVSMFLPWTFSTSSTPDESTLALLSRKEQQVESLHRRMSFVSSVSALKGESKQCPEPNAAPQVVLSSVGNIGLYNALDSTQTNRVWIGTLPNIIPLSEQQGVVSQLQTYSATPVFITENEMMGHYHRICKQLPDFTKGYDEHSWNQYVQVNQRFANTVASIYKPGDIIWVNDYHLMLVPGMLRSLIPDAIIGFFLHICFPSSEIFRCLHVRNQILNGLLGADLIGFQTYSFMRHFLMTCTRVLATDSTPKGIQLPDSHISMGIHPIGINLDSINEKRGHKIVKDMIESLREKYAGKRLLIGRDKNDYVKGLRQKMLAYERFLKEHPEWVGKVVLIQVALSTTEENENECHVTDVVSRINSSFGSIEYVPLVYLHQDISFYHYLALLTVADACIITSLRDGMNLTSHEYVVCQEEKHSPLVISEFAGTYGSFSAALRVNPYSGKEIADAIHEALVMGEEEKYYRWKVLYSHVASNSAQTFVETFCADLIKAHDENRLKMSSSIPLLKPEDIQESYASSKRRALFLDDDGTLFVWSRSGISDQGALSRMKDLLTTLCSDPCNVVYLMSGRRRDDLTSLMDVPNLGICAENGCFLKYADSNVWEIMLQDQDFSWRKNVLSVLEYYTDRTTGSFIEQKEICLVWNYALADKDFGIWQAAECQNHIQNQLGAIYPIHLLSKRKAVEIMPRNINKGMIIRRVLEHHYRKRHHVHSATAPSTLFPHHTVARTESHRERHPRTHSFHESSPPSSFFDHENPPVSELEHRHDRFDFILSIGDDRSDEYMFEYLDRIENRDQNRDQTRHAPDHQPSFSEMESWQTSMDSLPSPTSGSMVSFFENGNVSYRSSEVRKPRRKRVIVSCTVGRKSTAAKYYVNNVHQVLELLSLLI